MIQKYMHVNDELVLPTKRYKIIIVSDIQYNYFSDVGKDMKKVKVASRYFIP